MAKSTRAKDAARTANNIKKIVESKGANVSAWWDLIKQWLGRIIKALIALVLVIVQLIAAAASPAGSCGAGGGSDTLPDYATGGGGTVDQNIVKIAYDTVKQRYGNNPDGNRVLLATFEAGLAESNFQNLPGGDRDSVGYLQQRAGWGSFEERTNPTWATNKFLSALEANRKNHPNYTAHELAQATQASWCDKDQPPAAQSSCHGVYGGNYQAKQTQAQQLIDGVGGNFTVTGPGTDPVVAGADTVTPQATGACDTEGSFGNGGLLAGQKNVKVNSPQHGDFTIDVIPDGSRGAVISAAMTQLGVTYVFGGTAWKDGGTGGGLDCSAFVGGALKRGANITLPRTSKAQYAALPRKYTTKSELLPGDLIFYSDTGADAIHHVSMYLGMGSVGTNPAKVPLVIAAPSTGDVVKIQPYYTNGNMFFGDPGYTDTKNAIDAPPAAKPAAA